MSLPTKDKTDFDRYGLQALYVVPRLRTRTCEPRHSPQCSGFLKEVKRSRADERKSQRCKSLPHSPPKPPSLLSTESEDSAVLFQFYTAGFFSTHDSAHCLMQCTKSLPCLLHKAYRFNRFFLCGVMTPALTFRGPGF